MIYHLSALDLLSLLEDNSIDSAPMDPPYGLGFMNKGWDKVLPDPAIWRELLRVCKPGAHGAIFGGTRTEHRLGVRLEDAGWEIRDKLMWLYGSGFPKSHNITSDHGTALKPAWEPIYLIRKPFRGTVESCVLEHGTGVLNIRACRIGETIEIMRDGRWPANLIVDEVAAAMLDAQTGTLRTGAMREGQPRGGNAVYNKLGGAASKTGRAQDVGGASRFFYCAKASRREREEGLEDRIARIVSDGRTTGIDNPYLRGKTERLNTHPTVKPIELMRYLIRLITPEGGNVIDLFSGSGTTGIAAALEGRDFVGSELEAEFVELGNARIAHWTEKKACP